MSTIEEDVMVKPIEKSTKSKRNYFDSTHQQPETLEHETHSNFIDSLHFNDIAKQIGALKSLIYNAPDTNLSKIQVMKEEIAAGRYQINSHHIAAKLLEYVQSTTQAEAEMA